MLQSFYIHGPIPRVVCKKILVEPVPLDIIVSADQTLCLSELLKSAIFVQSVQFKDVPVVVPSQGRGSVALEGVKVLPPLRICVA